MSVHQCDRISREHRWHRLQQQMQRAAHLLEQQGTVASRIARTRRVWSVRYHDINPAGQQVHRAIYIGADQVLVQRARKLLQFLRTKRRCCEDAARLVRLSAAIVAVLRADLNCPRHQNDEKSVSEDGLSS